MQTETNRLENNQQIPVPIMNMNNTNSVKVIPIVYVSGLPLDASNELAQYSKVFITRQDQFRIVFCLEKTPSYTVFGELPDGDKKILFTVKIHFKYPNCCLCCYCADVRPPCNCCGICEIVYHDEIIFQFDYRRNNVNFYTQGIYLQEGCYCCSCKDCFLCTYDSCYSNCNVCVCGRPKLFLRENTTPDNPNFNMGTYKGMTLGTPPCCRICRSRYITYNSEAGIEGPTIKFSCCDAFKESYCDCCKFPCCTCCRCNDMNISIENEKEGKIENGSIIVPRGCYSSRVNKCCFYPYSNNYEITFPPNFTSIEKFQVIADLMHFQLETPLI